MAPLDMVQPVYDYPRRYTAKQLKTIYYSLNIIVYRMGIIQYLVENDNIILRVMDVTK